MNPNGTKSKPEEKEYSKVSQYQVSIQAQSEEGVAIATTSAFTKSAERYDDLSTKQKKDYKMKISSYKMKKKQMKKIAQELRIVDNALKSFARAYIPSNKMTSSVREIVKILTARYKRSNDQVIEQLHEQFLALKAPPIKDKIEA